MSYSFRKDDPIGNALWDYYLGNKSASILTWSDVEGWDRLDAKKLFRSWEEMPDLEKKALELCEGKVLDIGAGAGVHAEQLISKGHEVLALDHSFGAVELMKQRSINATQTDLFYWENELKYDTLLMLMNGIGICGDLAGLNWFLEKAKSWVNAKGRILFDSADLIYLFADEGSAYMNLEKNYYGETKYRMKYKHSVTDEFGWLFIDPERMRQMANEKGWDFTLIEQTNDFAYLGSLQLSQF
jgi:hypothetical protein